MPERENSERANRENIDEILKSWPYESQALSVRMREGSDGREVLQMRLDLGLLQLETTGRPDGTRPEGQDTYLAYLLTLVGEEIAEKLVNEATAEPELAEPDLGLEDLGLGEEDDEEDEGPADGFEMSEEQCREADREFVQYYHRRLCWLALREFSKAMEDADHTLALMDFCREYSPDEEWTLSHEQYRPFVLFHRTQAAALSELEKGRGAEASVEVINQGLERIRTVFVDHEAEEEFDGDELVTRLVEMREGLRQQFDVGNTLEEQLKDAIETEQYELAAKLRDELNQRRGGR